MIRKFYRAVLREQAVYRLVWAHPATPKRAKWLLRFIFVYLFSPLDLIPDVIPVLGLLDDLFIIPLALLAARSMIPAAVMAECRAQAANRKT